MKRLLFGCATIIAAWGAPSSPEPASPVEPPGRFIVSVDPGVEIEAVAADHGLTPRRAFTRAIHGFVGQIPGVSLRRIQSDPRVSAIVRDCAVKVFAEAAEDLEDSESTPGQVVPVGVERVGAAPGNVAFAGEDVGVAVVDTGLDFHHPDLQPLGDASFWVPEYGESAQDDHGHGTHVGGIIAARDNDLDVVGVAPRATLYAVKVLDKKGDGYDSDIIAGLEWILANVDLLDPPIKVVNLSLGRVRGPGDSALRAAVASLVSRGLVVVTAAGNDASKDVRDMVPAGFPEVIAVASTCAQTGAGDPIYGCIPADTASMFTTDGRMDRTGAGITISAPGEEQEDVDAQGCATSVGILSTKPGGGTTRMSGTSMAAPHVAGVVALLFEQNPNLLPLEAKVRVMQGTLVMEGPYDGRSTGNFVVPTYTFDGDREGILYAPNALRELEGP